MNSQLFYKAMAGFYDLLDVIYFRNYKKSPRRVVFHSIDDTDRVLDLCTGTATNALKIAKAKPLTKVIGIDLSKDMLQVANRKAKEANIHNIQLYRMDATKMKFKDQYFDKILLSLVLHEIEDDLAAAILADARRVLNDDGELIVTEWERSDKPLQKLVFLPIELLEPKPFKTVIKRDLSFYFQEYGFKVISETHCDYSKVLRLKKIPD